MGKNESWSQKNQAESVYDATFEDLVIHSQTGLDPEKEQVLYSLKLSGLDRFRYEAGQYLGRHLELVPSLYLKAKGNLLPYDHFSSTPLGFLSGLHGHF